MIAVPLRKDREEAVPDAAVSAGPTQAGARGRASSVPPLPSPGPSPGPAKPAPGDSPSPLAGAATALADRLSAVSGTSLLHARPPSLHSAWAAHADAARQWDAGVVRWPRWAWAVIHTGASGIAYVLLAVSASPAGLALAVILVAACWLWL